MTAKIIYDIPFRKALSAYVEAPFDEGKAILEADGYDIISAAKNAELRVNHGLISEVSQLGNWTSEAWLYVPGRDKVIFSKSSSPIIKNPVEATEAHRNAQEFYPTKEQIDIMLCAQLSIEIPYNQKPIPTNRFGENELTVFAFGNGYSKKAQAYGDFLGYSKNRKMFVSLPSKSLVDFIAKPFVRQNWICNSRFDCNCLNGRDVNLQTQSRVRGYLRRGEQ